MVGYLELFAAVESSEIRGRKQVGSGFVDTPRHAKRSLGGTDYLRLRRPRRLLRSSSSGP